MKLISYALTDIGRKRKINQDAFLKDDDLRLYIVADGMGGHRGGEVASRLAVETIQSYYRGNRSAKPRDVLDRGVNASCQKIFQQAAENPELAGMGTTIVAMLVSDGMAYFGQVGDSRAYLIRSQGIWQITEDHSLVNEEIRAGRLVAGQEANYQFRNVITRSVGYESTVNVDIYRRKIQVGDLFFMCTDGLSGLVSPQEIVDHLHQQGAERGLSTLVGLANARGGDDNITALACHAVD